MKRILFVVVLSLFSVSLQAQNLDSGLVSHYPLDGNANDLSGNNNHGTVNGAILDVDRNGNPNSCYYFDGIDDFINLGPDAADNVRAVSLWFSLDESITASLSTNKTLIYRNNQMSGGPGNDEFGIYFSMWSSPVGRLEFSRYIGTNTNFRVYSDAHSWETNSWSHVVAIIDSINGMKLYLDGVLQVSTDTSTKRVIATDDPTYLGLWGNASGSNRFFKGWIDEVRLYNRVITPAEINKLILGIEEKATRTPTIKVFPNPAKTYISIKLPPNLSGNNFIIEVLSVEGKRVSAEMITGENKIIHYNVDNLPDGIYFLRVKSEKETFIQKMIVG